MTMKKQKNPVAHVSNLELTKGKCMDKRKGWEFLRIHMNMHEINPKKGLSFLCALKGALMWETPVS